jgi:low temperature requirement protein LtrA
MTTPPWLRPMGPRSTQESHRASTPLELLFDLCFVVAVSQAASQLSHGITTGSTRSGIVGYLMVFFAIWWAWMNFTWFASAYDTDDVAYRLLTFVQIGGVLILAAGVAGAFTRGDYATITVGYVVMRVAMVAQWLRAARADPPRRAVALRYVAGVTLVQVGWVVRLFLPHSWGDADFLVLAACELAVPVWAEHAGPMTPWHPAHISERYGLFTLIVLGESVAAATVATQVAVTADRLSGSLAGIAVGGLLLVFGLWWWYFEHPVEEGLRLTPRLAYAWGYAHYLVFAAVAAFGAGLEVAVDADSRSHGPSVTSAALAVALPVSVFLMVTGAILARLALRPPRWWSTPATAAALVAVALVARWTGLGWSVVMMGTVVGVLIVADARTAGSATGPATSATGGEVQPGTRGE